jgi:hypothetical protein
MPPTTALSRPHLGLPVGAPKVAADSPWCALSDVHNAWCPTFFLPAAFMTTACLRLAAAWDGLKPLDCWRKPGWKALTTPTQPTCAHIEARLCKQVIAATEGSHKLAS